MLICGCLCIHAGITFTDDQKGYGSEGVKKNVERSLVIKVIPNHNINKRGRKSSKSSESAVSAVTN